MISSFFAVMLLFNLSPLTPSITRSSRLSLYDDDFTSFVSLIESMQGDIINKIEREETAIFTDDPWEIGQSRGRTRVIEDGSIIEVRVRRYEE